MTKDFLIIKWEEELFKAQTNSRIRENSSLMEIAAQDLKVKTIREFIQDLRQLNEETKRE